MTLENLRDFLAWCTAINIGLIVLWFVFFTLAHDLMYRMHGKLFRLSTERFDAIHYALLAVFKLLIIVFNLVPYLVLRIIG